MVYTRCMVGRAHGNAAQGSKAMTDEHNLLDGWRGSKVSQEAVNYVMQAKTLGNKTLDHLMDEGLCSAGAAHHLRDQERAYRKANYVTLAQTGPQHPRAQGRHHASRAGQQRSRHGTAVAQWVAPGGDTSRGLHSALQHYSTTGRG